MIPEENHRTLEASPGVLTRAPVACLIVYVHDLTASRVFYEAQLGLQVIEADESSVKLDAGQVILSLHRAEDYGVRLVGRCDDSSDIVFLVDDVNLMREALESRGVTFVRRRTYEIGLVTDFYDPDGHRLMIYQPSAKALSWPSAAKLRSVWNARGRGGTDLIGPPATVQRSTKRDARRRGLNGKPLVYLFLFVPDSEAARDFYEDRLGLRAVERVHCCNPACPPEEKGIVKYDVGGMLLTTHHIHRSPVVDDFGKVYSPHAVDPAHTRGIAPVFLVPDVRDAVRALDGRVPFPDGVVRSHIGELARLVAPTGHTFFLYQPSDGALQWPAGNRLRGLMGG